MYTLWCILTVAQFPSARPFFNEAAEVPVSGLVVTFDAPVARHSVATGALKAIPEVVIGDAAGSKLAIVVDSSNKRRDQEVWNAVRELPGVIDLAVALVAFDEDDPAPEPLESPANPST